jgi:hypothetical protein
MVGLALLVAVVVGLVELGVVPNPFAASVSGDVALARSSRPGLRVLFVGNSFTYRNSMPSLVRSMSEGDGDPRRLFVVQYTKSGGTLSMAARDDRLTDLVREVHWDVVVLQEQSEIPSLPAAEREGLMDRAASDLVRRASASGARTVLFLTWGYRHGDRRRVDGDDYEAMQARLAAGYRSVAAETGATVAPVGTAWAEALRRRPELGLWAGDGRHPSKLGSYLAACVFYGLLTHRDPQLLHPPADALAEHVLLERVASDVLHRIHSPRGSNGTA